jgi:hypothetical protein
MGRSSEAERAARMSRDRLRDAHIAHPVVGLKARIITLCRSRAGFGYSLGPTFLAKQTGARGASDKNHKRKTRQADRGQQIAVASNLAFDPCAVYVSVW